MADSAEPHQAFVLKGHIQRGDPAPWWRQGRHRFAFDPAGGRYIVLCFYGTARDAMGQAALRALDGNRRFEGRFSRKIPLRRTAHSFYHRSLCPPGFERSHGR